MVILTPGPTEIPNEVLASMLKSVNPDLDQGFFNLYNELAGSIKKMINHDGSIYVMSGEGMLGLEAAIANTVKRDDKVLSISNGVFGESFADLARGYGAQVTTVNGPYDEPVDASKMPDLRNYRAVTFVYVETPAGLINPIGDVAKVVKQSDALFIVDAVSAVGGVPVDCKSLGVDICLMASQKAFSSTPGLAIVAVSDRAKAEMKRVNYGGYYMNINKWDENLGKGMFPYTPSANDILALKTAIDMIYAEGLESVYRRHEESRNATISALKSMGIVPFVKDIKYAAPTVTAFYSPLDPMLLLDFTWKKLGVMLAGSWGPLAGKVMRIGHMGYTARKDFVIQAIAALAAAMNNYGSRVDIESAVRAANREFSSPA
ncbi:MAG: alanine--glyoxylate aminotransferase family protein [Nitrososphaerota archaeon]|jgi:alanine-glyoxylate transaminase/serine-glyoxylate transaminase/serine-pyruvate transaminase|nr:alanine--glyoxylate aminotransferase family protein [Nitrososphaerota archaeon]MDG6932095.1 alanine--glyoxylate aminotransferase family protein [Nitrososphaerota archaeon]MDG6935627.1 alanine--glyoxylate aminotransferase family protein [Nitrososphaerota archaeon]